MSAEPTISLAPKTRFLASPAVASAHSDVMASPSFQAAASAAMLAYQRNVLTVDPAGLTVAAAKLRGAQEYLDVLLNLGLPNTHTTSTVDTGLIPPEQSLSRPYKAPTP